MNIVIVMSGGIGARFGAVIPKQYNLIAGRPVIDYVLDAVEASQKTDRIVIVMDKQWVNYSGKICNGGYDIASGGNTRHESLYNGLKHIKDNYTCNKVVVVDAVAPFIYGELIDDYFDRLDNYDAVITSQKITGGFTDIHDRNLDREKYIITQSPEGFRFEPLWNNFDSSFPFQETAGMLPKGSKRYYHYGFRNNLKLTYDYDLAYAEFVLENQGRINSNSQKAYFDKKVLITEGLKAFLLRNEPEKTMEWLDGVYASMPRLLSEWEITSFLPNQISRYGLVLKAKSSRYGNVIMKFIPGFVNRYERELEAMRILSGSFMCRLIDASEEDRCMLLEEISPAKYGRFEESEKLTEFFSHVIQEAVPYSEDYSLQYIPYYFDELKDKLSHADTMPYCRELIEPELAEAVQLFQQVFSDAKLYIVHGDLHEENILDDGKRFYGIDPNGMVSPIELECVRFVRNDVRNHADSGLEERFDLLLKSFARFVDIYRFVNMFIIDMAFCTFNSVFENETPQETLIDLELIRIAKDWKNKYANKTIENEKVNN